MSSILQVRQNGGLVDVPILRGKSAYEQALEGGFNLGEIINGEVIQTILPEEKDFNKVLSNMVVGPNAFNEDLSQIYQIKFSYDSNGPTENTPDNVITIVLGEDI